MEIKKIDIPVESLLVKFFPADYTDAFRITADSDIEASPDDILISFWTDMPGWVNRLFAIRNFLVRFVGLEGSNEKNAGELEKCIREGGSYRYMEVPLKNDHETVMVLKDKHLDAYISIYKDDARSVTASTLVHYNNRLGRIYFFVIKPFHEAVVLGTLKRAVRKFV